MITKLSSIPQDETFKLRERSIALLEKVNQRLAEEPEEEHEGKSDDKQNGSEDTPSKEEKEKTNGASKHEKADEEAAANEKEAEKENSGKKDLKEVEMRDAPEPKAATATTAADEDTAMSE